MAEKFRFTAPDRQIGAGATADTGSIIPTSGAVPVILKSLVFPPQPGINNRVSSMLYH